MTGLTEQGPLAGAAGGRRTISDELADRAAQTPHAAAIMAPGRVALTYGELGRQARAVGAALRGWGIGRSDRVAVLLPTGPELAVACLCVSASATLTLLNPAYEPAEIELYLTTLRVRALIAPAGAAAGRAVAERLGVAVYTLTARPDGPAGLFTLDGLAVGPPAAEEPARPEHIATVARTSGTTARPKVVPLSHGILLARAAQNCTTMRLTAADRFLPLLPLYNAGYTLLLPALLSGGAAVVPSEVTPEAFFTCLRTCQPTWGRTVPTLAQAILARTPQEGGQPWPHSLRWLIVQAAALPGPVQAGLEALLGVPVLSSYGMTEVSSIARTPLPPLRTKPGSVGVTSGLDVAIMDAQGAIVGPGQSGEVVVRGATVFQGYEGDPQANQQAFLNGWFRTGDAGYLDAEGYLFLTGRFKEMIKRGGAQVAPAEVEEVLLAHPAVAQAAVFALPHPTLGEDVAAAVVPRPGHAADEVALRTFVGERLSAYKVPRRVVFVAELPISSAGKVLRLGLAERLGVAALSGPPPYVAPRDALEEQLATLWREILGVQRVGIHDDFFALGGQSLHAAQLFTRIGEVHGKQLPLGTLFAAGTVATLADHLRGGPPPEQAIRPSLVAIQPLGGRPPLFCVHPGDGNILWYRYVGRYLAPDQPLYGVQALPGEVREMQSLRPVATMAADYLRDIRDLQPSGPYYLAGYSGGGALAYEMARQLEQQGQRVGLLVLFDSPCPRGAAGNPTFVASPPLAPGEWLRYHLAILRYIHPRDRRAYIWQRLDTLRAWVARRGPARATPGDLLRRASLQPYTPGDYSGPILLFWAQHNPDMDRPGQKDPRLGWFDLAAGRLEVAYVPGNHGALLYEPAIARRVAEALRVRLATHT